jgi:large subunit ribosomal protein L6
MSRVGRKPIAIPKDVKVSVSGAKVLVQGPKGKLETPVPPGIAFEVRSAPSTAWPARWHRTPSRA